MKTLKINECGIGSFERRREATALTNKYKTDNGKSINTKDLDYWAYLHNNNPYFGIIKDAFLHSNYYGPAMVKLWDNKVLWQLAWCNEVYFTDKDIEEFASNVKEVLDSFPDGTNFKESMNILLDAIKEYIFSKDEESYALLNNLV